MPRYIDKDEALKRVSWDTGAYQSINMMLSADVVERKAGEWTERKIIEDGKAIEEWQSARCSVCGKIHTTPYLYYFDDFAFCPNCGAEMKGESNANDNNQN